MRCRMDGYVVATDRARKAVLVPHLTGVMRRNVLVTEKDLPKDVWTSMLRPIILSQDCMDCGKEKKTRGSSRRDYRRHDRQA